MAQIFVTLYALLAMFVILCMQRNHREQRPTPRMMTMVGWGLYSLSSTLAMLLGALAVALALGFQTPLPAGLDAPLL